MEKHFGLCVNKQSDLFIRSIIELVSQTTNQTASQAKSRFKRVLISQSIS